MQSDAWLTLGLIVGLLVLLIWDRFPTWAVFAGALLVIFTLGLAPEFEAFSGFSNSGVLSVVVLFVVAEGMYRTGAIGMIIDRVVGLPESERSANLRIMPITAAGSAIINNTPIVAMLVPVVADLGRSARLAATGASGSVLNEGRLESCRPSGGTVAGGGREAGPRGRLGNRPWCNMRTCQPHMAQRGLPGSASHVRAPTRCQGAAGFSRPFAGYGNGGRVIRSLLR